MGRGGTSALLEWPYRWSYWELRRYLGSTSMTMDGNGDLPILPLYASPSFALLKASKVPHSSFAVSFEPDECRPRLRVVL